MRVLMTGGGTAGHVNPALAIAGIIKEREPDSVIEFIGTKKGIESRLVPEAGYSLHTIEVYGIRRSLSPSNIKIMYKALHSISECKKIIKAFKPDAVIGTGGYVSWPVIMAASALKIPCALHEANAMPGLAIKTLRKKADLIMVGFESAAEALKGGKSKKVLTGLPVKKGFRESGKLAARKRCGISNEYKKVILSFGGSLGAQTMNEVSLKFIDSYMKKHPECCYIHSVGSRAYEEYINRLEKTGNDKLSNVKVLAYINNMPDMLNAADIAVCRAGASTLAELAASSCPSILVPSPNVTNDQQTKNARMFEKKGACRMICDKDFSADVLAQIIDSLSDKDLKSMSKNLKELDFPSCEDLIYKEICGIIKR